MSSWIPSSSVGANDSQESTDAAVQWMRSSSHHINTLHQQHPFYLHQMYDRSHLGGFYRSQHNQLYDQQFGHHQQEPTPAVPQSSVVCGQDDDGDDDVDDDDGGAAAANCPDANSELSVNDDEAGRSQDDSLPSNGVKDNLSSTRRCFIESPRAADIYDQKNIAQGHQQSPYLLQDYGPSASSGILGCADSLPYYPNFPGSSYGFDAAAYRGYHRQQRAFNSQSPYHFGSITCPATGPGYMSSVSGFQHHPSTSSMSQTPSGDYMSNIEAYASTTALFHSTAMFKAAAAASQIRTKSHSSSGKYTI